MLGEWCYASKKKPMGTIVDEVTHCNSSSCCGGRKRYVNMEIAHVYVYTLSVRPVRTVLINIQLEQSLPCRFSFLIFLPVHSLLELEMVSFLQGTRLQGLHLLFWSILLKFF